jgi:glycolate oxidase
MLFGEARWCVMKELYKYEYIADLVAKLHDRVLTEEFERYVYGTDWSPRTVEEIYPPDVVVCPQTTEDVVIAVNIAYKYGIPVTVGGGLTGMAGGAVPIHGGIYIDSTTMNDLIETDITNQTVRVQAGMTLQEINDALEKYDLWLPHLTESKWSCTIGASIACDNDSTFGMRYGKILHCLLSAQIVTGTGDVLELGHRKAHFTSSGYKLKDLLAGSEGTLGVLTEVTLKVEPIPDMRVVEMLLLPSIQSAVDLLSLLLKAGLCVEAAHINCKRRLKFYTHAYRKKFGKEPEIPDWAEGLLAITFAGDKEVVEYQKEYLLKKSNMFNAQRIEEREIVDGWWTSKHTLQFEPFKQKWPDSQREKKFGAADPGIPPGRLEEFYQKFIEIAEKYTLEVLGMNSYLEHPNSLGLSLSCAVFVDYRNQEEVHRFRSYFKELTKTAVDFEGTMSTYMSDTNLKVRNFEYEHGKSAEYMKKIKEIFDPRGIMNPGKKFTSHQYSVRGWIR